LGKSPKVFDKGWLFGAAFKLTDENGEEIDLSDKIEWSGTGHFEPDKGASCRPVFDNIGENKIILTVEHEGKTYKKEYPVITVEANKYARIGSMADCPADSHGSLADPMPVIGWVITGNANVLIDGLPAACEGDRGIHVACAGPNTFVISSEGCDWEVLINGKKAAKKNTTTRHCGGMGEIIRVESSGEVQNMLLALSDDISFADKDGKKIPQNSNPAAGTKMVTGPKGLLLMSPDRNTVMMVLPNSHASITNNTDKDLFIELQDGSIFINGEKADNNRNLIIESFNEKLIRKGTRFLFTRSGDTSKLIVYEGEVDVLMKKDNSTITVPAGKVYYNDSKSPYVIKDTARFESSAVLVTIPKSNFNINRNEETAASQTTASKSQDFLSILKQYWYVGVAVVLLVIGARLLSKRKKGSA
ncbi:MAG TPA: PAAR domain-containing protein, partial [Chitinophagaceae bacterium]